MSKGYVYILSNPAMPGLVKVGKTTRDVSARANELFQTGVPMPFKEEYSVLSPDCDELEMQMHEALGNFRVSEGREFFQTDASHATTCLEGLVQSQVVSWAEEFVCGYTLVSEIHCVDEMMICKLADEMGAKSFEVAAAMSRLRPEELERALGQYRDQIAERRKIIQERRSAE